MKDVKNYVKKENFEVMVKFTLESLHCISKIIGTDELFIAYLGKHYSKLCYNRTENNIIVKTFSYGIWSTSEIVEIDENILREIIAHLPNLITSYFETVWAF